VYKDGGIYLNMCNGNILPFGFPSAIRVSDIPHKILCREYKFCITKNIPRVATMSSMHSKRRNKGKGKEKEVPAAWSEFVGMRSTASGRDIVGSRASTSMGISFWTLADIYT
jgi:hypothetical protein